jgi:hypothetical protein
MAKFANGEVGNGRSGCTAYYGLIGPQAPPTGERMGKAIRQWGMRNGECGKESEGESVIAAQRAFAEATDGSAKAGKIKHNRGKRLH